MLYDADLHDENLRSVWGEYGSFVCDPTATHRRRPIASAHAALVVNQLIFSRCVVSPGRPASIEGNTMELEVACNLPRTGGGSALAGMALVAVSIGLVLMVVARKRGSTAVVVALILITAVSSAPVDAAAPCPPGPTTIAPPPTTAAPPTTAPPTTVVALGSLAGTYRRSSVFTGDGPAVGATVTLSSAGPDGTFGTGDDSQTTTTTDSNGTYAFSSLPPGSYSVSASLPIDEASTITNDAEAVLGGWTFTGAFGSATPAGLAVEVRFSGADGILGTADDEFYDQNYQTGAGGTFFGDGDAFFVTGPRLMQLSVADPGHIGRTWPMPTERFCLSTATVTAWVLAPVATGLDAGENRTGVDLLADNNVTASTQCP
jgi:hypothetical protein